MRNPFKRHPRAACAHTYRSAATADGVVKCATCGEVLTRLALGRTDPVRGKFENR